jgi:methyl-accepting chemotaxis protein
MIRRKNYFIKKSFQAKFFLRFIGLITVEALLIACLFMYISSQTLTTGYSAGGFTIDRTSSFFLPSFIGLTVIVGLAVGIAGTLVFIYLSHSIAGPLYRFEAALQAMARGNLKERINLRKTDQLSGLQETLNLAMKSMDAKVGEIKGDIDRACAAGSGPDKTKDALSEIKGKIDFFKTT